MTRKPWIQLLFLFSAVHGNQEFESNGNGSVVPSLLREHKATFSAANSKNSFRRLSGEESESEDEDSRPQEDYDSDNDGYFFLPQRPSASPATRPPEDSTSFPGVSPPTLELETPKENNTDTQAPDVGIPQETIPVEDGSMATSPADSTVGGSVTENGNPTESPSAAVSQDADIGLGNTNIIQIPLSVGIYNIDRLTQRRARLLVGVVVRVTTLLLDTYSPFEVQAPVGIAYRYVRHLLQDEEEENIQNTLDQESIEGKVVYQARDNRTVVLDSVPNLVDALDKRNTQERDIPRTLQDQPSKDEDSLARFVLSSIAVSESNDFYAGTNGWLRLVLQYDAFWLTGDPILYQRVLRDFEMACLDVIHTTIDAMVFEKELIEEDRRFRGIGSSDSSDDERDRMVSLVARGRYERQDWIRQNQAVIAVVVRAGGEYVIDDSWYLEDSSDEENKQDQDGIQYTEPLELEWGLREWFGLGLLISTLVLSTVLVLTAHYLLQKQSTQEVWGRSLTEEGVGELLQVGWSYQRRHPGDTSSGGDGEDHLFLQVYDKSRFGYSDDSSMLQGSLVAAGYPPDARPPRTHETVTGSATRSTSTPPSPGQDVVDDDSP